MLVGILVFILSSTWRRGRDLLRDIFKEKRTPVEEFLQKFRQEPPQRVEGMAIYPTASTEGMLGAFLSQLEHFKVAHESVVLLTLITESVPRIPKKDMIEKEDLGQGFSRVISRQGFMEHRNIAEIFDLLKSRELANIDLEKATFIMGQANVIPEGFKMSRTRSKLFAFVMRNALPITEFIKIPCSRVIELAVLVEL